MVGKYYIIFSVGIISLFAGVVYTLVNVTDLMITEQTQIMDARFHGQISEGEFQSRSRESESAYRNNVADALEKIESKFLEVARIVKSISGLMDTLPESDEQSVRLIDQEVSITTLDDNRHVVYLNETPYDIEDLFLDVKENNSVVMKVVVIQQDNYYQYHPYLRGNMSEILNISEDYNYSADLDSIAGNLTVGIENLRTESIT
jgi:hypothetical protein